MVFRPTVRRLVMLALVGALAGGAGAAGLAQGQDGSSHARDGRGGRGGKRTPTEPATPTKSGSGTGHATTERGPASDTAEPDAPEGRESEGSDASTSFHEEGGTKVKVLEFSGLDVSGRLKSPQLLYFLNRVRAEFDRPRLPHRSFIGEMERSTHEKSF
ncbi:MAG: hypothetical protein U0234_07895 [Sandaracinus sp.]